MIKIFMLISLAVECFASILPFDNFADDQDLARLTSAQKQPTSSRKNEKKFLKSKTYKQIQSHVFNMKKELEEDLTTTPLENIKKTAFTPSRLDIFYHKDLSALGFLLAYQDTIAFKFGRRKATELSEKATTRLANIMCERSNRGSCLSFPLSFCYRPAFERSFIAKFIIERKEILFHLHVRRKPDDITKINIRFLNSDLYKTIKARMHYIQRAFDENPVAQLEILKTTAFTPTEDDINHYRDLSSLAFLAYSRNVSFRFNWAKKAFEELESFIGIAPEEEPTNLNFLSRLWSCHKPKEEIFSRSFIAEFLLKKVQRQKQEKQRYLNQKVLYQPQDNEAIS